MTKSTNSSTSWPLTHRSETETNFAEGSPEQSQQRCTEATPGSTNQLSTGSSLRQHSVDTHGCKQRMADQGLISKAAQALNVAKIADLQDPKVLKSAQSKFPSQHAPLQTVLAQKNEAKKNSSKEEK